MILEKINKPNDIKENLPWQRDTAPARAFPAVPA